MATTSEPTGMSTELHALTHEHLTVATQSLLDQISERIPGDTGKAAAVGVTMLYITLSRLLGVEVGDDD